MESNFIRFEKLIKMLNSWSTPESRIAGRPKVWPWGGFYGDYTIEWRLEEVGPSGTMKSPENGTELLVIQVSEEMFQEPLNESNMPNPYKFPYLLTRQFQLQGVVSTREARQPVYISKADSNMMRSSGKRIV